MKSRAILAMAAMAATLLAQGPAPGRRMGGPGGEMRGAMAARGAAGTEALKTALGLTDTQVEQLRTLRQQQSEAARPTMDEMRSKRQALATAMKSATPDSTLVGQLMVDIRKLGETLKNGRADYEAKAQGLLTPEQKAKLATLEEARKLMPAVGQATALGLLAPPEVAAGAMAGAGPAQRGERGAARAGRMQRR